MNEDRIYEIIDLLQKLEQGLDNLEKIMKPKLIEIRSNELVPSDLYKRLADSDCMHRNFKPATPVGISCPCPRCTPYSMSYGGVSSGEG